MTDNKGDLISREALKERFDDYIKANPNISGVFELGKFIIDNAPTVELFCSYLSDGEVRQPCVESPCKHERPQGEWIIIKSPLSTETVVKCPFCGDEFIGNDVEDYNFCPICGAQMKRGGET